MKSGGRCQYVLKLSKQPQSTLIAEFNFGFTEGSFLLLNGQKHFRSIAEDLISNKQKRTKQAFQKGEDIIKLSANISQQVITLSDFHSACENKCHVIKTLSV